MATEVTARTRDALGTFDDIAAAAVRTTGLEDFGGTEHEEGLRLLCEDLVEHGGLTPEGNYMQRTFIKSALVGRLLAEHGFKEHPSYAEVPIERPIFVCGLPRTGTTALHRLLNADPAHQGLELWLTEVPQPRPPRETWDDNPIYAALNAAFSEHHIENPEFMGIHYMDASSVEECWRILRQSGKSIGYESLAYVPEYSAWLEKQDWTDAYERHKRQPAADRAQRPGEAVGAEEPVTPRRARRDHDGLPGRADRADPPRPARRDRLGVLALGGGHQGLVDGVRRRHDRPHPARHAEQGGGAVRARARGVRPRSSSSTSTTASSSATRSARPRPSTRRSASSGRPGSTRRSPSSTPSHARAGASPKHSYDLADYGLTEDEVRAAF